MKRVNQNRLPQVLWWWGLWGKKGMAFFIDRDNVILMEDDGNWCLRELRYDKPNK